MPGLEIQQLTPDAPIQFSADDLRAHLAAHDPNRLLVRETYPQAQGPFARIPGHRNLALQWANITHLGDSTAPDRFRLCTPETATDFIDDYEAELARLAMLGVKVPPHVSYLVHNDPYNEAPTLYTAARQSKSNNPLSVFHGRGYPDQTKPSHLYGVTLDTCRTIFRYYTERSFRPWRIATAQSLGMFSTNREVMFLQPDQVDPTTGADEALSSMRVELTLLPGSEQLDELQEDILRYGRRKLDW